MYCSLRKSKRGARRLCKLAADCGIENVSDVCITFSKSGSKQDAKMLFFVSLKPSNTAAPKRAYSSFAILTKATPSVSSVAGLIGISMSYSSIFSPLVVSVFKMSATSFWTFSSLHLGRLLIKKYIDMSSSNFGAFALESGSTACMASFCTTWYRNSAISGFA